MNFAERWVEIEEFSNYAVSDYGRVMNIRTGRILVQSINNNGYLWVTFYNNQGKFTKTVHRIVSEAFLGKTPIGLTHNQRCLRLYQSLKIKPLVVGVLL